MLQNRIGTKSRFLDPEAVSPTQEAETYYLQRRLRHCTAIALRNLDVGSGDHDTDMDEQQTRSSNELVKPQQGRSFNTNSVSGVESGASATDADATPIASALVAQMPLMPRRHTRTMTILSEDDQLLQTRRMRRVIARHLRDSFASIHTVGPEDRLLYVTPLVRCAMNPNYQPFSLTETWVPDRLLRSFILRIWARVSNGKETLPGKWKCIVDQKVLLEELVYLGEDYEHIDRRLHPNTLLISLVDGVYTIAQSLVYKTSNSSSPHISESLDRKDSHLDADSLPMSASSTTPTLSSSAKSSLSESSSDTKVRKTREMCSTEALYALLEQELYISETQESTLNFRKQIAEVLEASGPARTRACEIAGLRDRLDQLKQQISTQTTGLSEKRQQANVVIERMKHMRASVALSQSMQTRIAEQRIECQRAQQKAQHDALMVARDLAQCHFRVINALKDIYTIDQLDGDAFMFMINRLPLPNGMPRQMIMSPSNSQSEAVWSAALGYVGHFVYLMALYLHVPLRYPIQPMGSTSYINDPVAIMMGSRKFPLFSRGQDANRYEYAIYLLNKNIEQLMNSQGLMMMDLGSTLPNCKYLLLWLTTVKESGRMRSPSPPVI